MARKFGTRRRNRGLFGALSGNLQKKVKKINQSVQASQGSPGDQALRSIPGKGLFSLVKDGGRWKYSRYMEGPLSCAEEISASVPNISFIGSNTTKFSGDVLLRKGNSSLRFFDSDSTHYTGFKAHATTTSSIDYTLPAAPPGANRVLQSTSAGVLSWETQGGGGNMANNTILGNISGSTGVGGDLTGSQVRTLCGIDSDDSVAFGEITSGSVVWADYPFNGYAMQNARGYFFRDSDDYDDFRRWDDFDTDMVLNYRKIWGHYVVPEDCTLKRMQGIVANNGDTEDVTVNVWYCLQADIETDTTSTTFSKAGSDNDVTIGTSLVGVQFNEDYDVDLTAGSIVIPTLKTAGSSSQTYHGTLTLKYITR